MIQWLGLGWDSGGDEKQLFGYLLKVGWLGFADGCGLEKERA